MILYVNENNLPLSQNSYNEIIMILLRCKSFNSIGLYSICIYLDICLLNLVAYRF